MLAYMTAALFIMFSKEPSPAHSQTAGEQRPGPTIFRKRRSVDSIFLELGPTYVKRAYRMDEAAFWLLHQMLAPSLKKICRGPGNPKKKTKINARNGIIPTSTRLSIALRYFAGGSVYDIKVVHRVSSTEVFRSVWRVLDAVNQHPGLAIQFPVDHDEQHKIAAGFKTKSQAGLDCCAGCIDGVLIWTEKPSLSDCTLSTCGAKNFSVVVRRNLD